MIKIKNEKEGDHNSSCGLICYRASAVKRSQAGNGILYIQEVLNMHAWEQIQESIEFIESHLGEELSIRDLAEKAALSPFYYQRLFRRLVKKPAAFKGQKDFGHSGGAGFFLPRTFQQNL